MRHPQLGRVCGPAAAGPRPSVAARGQADLPGAGNAAGAPVEQGDGRGRAALREELRLLTPAVVQPPRVRPASDEQARGGPSEACLLDLAGV